jgi:hypothetical protein
MSSTSDVILDHRYVKTDIYGQYLLFQQDKASNIVRQPSEYLTKLINMTFTNSLVRNGNGIVKGFKVKLNKFKLRASSLSSINPVYENLIPSNGYDIDYRDSEFLRITVDPGIAVVDSVMTELMKYSYISFTPYSLYSYIKTLPLNYLYFLIVTLERDSTSRKIIVNTHIAIYDDDNSPNINNVNLVSVDSSGNMITSPLTNPTKNFIVLGVFEYYFDFAVKKYSKLNQFYYNTDTSFNPNMEKNELYIKLSNNTFKSYEIHPVSVIEEKFIQRIVVKDNNKIDKVLEQYTEIDDVSLLSLEDFPLER